MTELSIATFTLDSLVKCLIPLMAVLTLDSLGEVPGFLLYLLQILWQSAWFLTILTPDSLGEVPGSSDGALAFSE